MSELVEILKRYNTLDKEQHEAYRVDNTEEAQQYLKLRVDMEHDLAHRYGLVFGWSSDLQQWGLFPQD